MSRLFERLQAFRGAHDDSRLAEALWEEFGCERTVLVLDMAGFTITARTKGVVYYLTLIEQMRNMTRPLVQAAGGQVVKYEADNLFAVFPSPGCAMTCVENAFEETLRVNEGRECEAMLRLCAGLDHGRILLDETDFFGDAVNLASKLGEDMARSGEVLISSRSHESLCGGAYHFKEVGNHDFFGSPEPFYCWQRECSQKAG